MGRCAMLAWRAARPPDHGIENTEHAENRDNKNTHPYYNEDHKVESPPQSLHQACCPRKPNSESRRHSLVPPVALVHGDPRCDSCPFRLRDQRTRAEAGMPRLVIRLSTLQPIFASIR
jgi:hypothetical protein